MLLWVATEMRTGRVIAELPGLDVDQVADTMGRYESATATLPLMDAPPEWERATKPGAAVLNLLDTDTMTPLWGGFVTKRPRTEGDTIDLSLATIPAYFDRRYVGDETFTGVPQSVIVQQLVEKYAAAGANGGIPIRVEVVDPGTTRSQTYKDADNQTLYTALQNLMGVDGGPEWRVGWEIAQTPALTITPVLYVGTMLGQRITPGLSPRVVFEMPGTAMSVQEVEDYSSGAGANLVRAYSTDSNGVPIRSDDVVTVDGDRPTFEYRWQPSSSIIYKSTLDAHAHGLAPQLAGGTETLQLSAAHVPGFQLGTDWDVGDDIGFKIGGLIVNDNGQAVESVPSFPGHGWDGYAGVARAYGYTLDLSDPVMVSPLLVPPAVGS